MTVNASDICDNAVLLEVGRKAVEDVLIDMRDSGLSLLDRRNGLVVYGQDGHPSSIIRLGMEQALKIALQAIVEHVEQSTKG